MRKRVKKGIKYILVLIIGVLMLGTISQAVFKYFELKKIDEAAYGQAVDVDGKKMIVEIVGDGSETIVILPSLANPSPILEFRQLAGLLSDNFKIITVEPFGYGLSDGTNKERSVENISEELHTCLQLLGLSEYYLMPHSISGAYSLYYSETYPNEVKGIIGLDTSVPGMYSEVPDVINFLEGVSPYISRAKNIMGISRLSARFDSDFYVPAVNEYEWTQEEKQLLKWITLNKSYNKTVMKEIKNKTDNLSKMQSLKFSEDTPVLFFLSENNTKMIPAWQKLHENLIQEKERSKIIILSGSHYVYYNHGKEIDSTVTQWISDMNE